MKKKLLSLLALVVGLGSYEASAQRYLADVFPDVTVTPGVIYSYNISVLSGQPAMDTLRMDVYRPANDTSSKRPLLIYLHTGSFLPPIVNGSPTGSNRDSAIVAACKRFAARGFVVAAPRYRVGWNPQGADQPTRLNTLLNAVYRANIDAKTCVRFFKRNFVENGNAYGVDTSRIVMIGQGSGGYVYLAAATLNKVAEINLPKFLNPSNGQSYVNQALSGNFDGTDSTMLNKPNHAAYSSKFQMAVNMGGAIGDSTWLEAGDIPIVGFHSVNDPFAPFTYGTVVVPGTTMTVVDVSGSKQIVDRANRLGNNNAMNALMYNDPYSMQIDANNMGIKSLWPMYIAPTTNPQAGPWDYWDSTIVKNITLPGGFSGATAHAGSMLTNPNMSKAKSAAYVDTIVNYLCPRIGVVLGLPGNVAVNETSILSVGLYPNPTTDGFNVRVAENASIDQIELIDLSGRVIRRYNQYNSNTAFISTNDINKGIYLVRVTSGGKSGVQKVSVE
jgi:hypothetical protein